MGSQVHTNDHGPEAYNLFPDACRRTGNFSLLFLCPYGAPNYVGLVLSGKYGLRLYLLIR